MKVLDIKYLDFLYLEKYTILPSAIHNNSLEIKKVQHNLPQPFDESYTHDTRGNRLTSLNRSYNYNDLNQLTDSTTHTHSYDADGNLIEEKNKITTENKKYYYNSENRLIAFEHYPNDVSPADIVAAYKYDTQGRRLQKNVNGTVANFFWEGDNLALELDENLQPIRRYVYGVGKDDVEGYVKLSEVTGGMFDQFKQGWYSYIKDQVGTIYKVYSDYTQQMIDTRTHDVFGNMVNQTGSSTGNLGFHSKYYDQESGLNYFYHRYYNPVNGRFINEDPVGVNSGFNLYNFVYNNPINWIDPHGLDAYTDNSRIRNWMCCIWWKAHGDPGKRIYNEYSFMLYEHRTSSGFYWHEKGQESDERYGNTSRFPQRPGFNFKGYFHTHPPGESQYASGSDYKTSNDFDIPVYTIADTLVTKWYKGKGSRIMFTSALKAWCLSNRSSWEEECCKEYGDNK